MRSIFISPRHPAAILNPVISATPSTTDRLGANEMVVGIMAVVAQAERKMISARTKAALQAARARGVKLGGLRHREDGSVVKLDAATIAAGRPVRTAKSAARATDLAPIIDDIKARGASSLREIAAGLNERGIPTARGGVWSAVQVQRVMNRPGAM
jgi:DNA invertase Pin-like site-specific DNA recombinase